MTEEIRNQMKYLESVAILRWLLEKGVLAKSVLDTINKKNAQAWRCKVIELV